MDTRDHANIDTFAYLNTAHCLLIKSNILGYFFEKKTCWLVKYFYSRHMQSGGYRKLLHIGMEIEPKALLEARDNDQPWRRPAIDKIN